MLAAHALASRATVMACLRREFRHDQCCIVHVYYLLRTALLSKVQAGPPSLGSPCLALMECCALVPYGVKHSACIHSLASYILTFMKVQQCIPQLVHTMSLGVTVSLPFMLQVVGVYGSWHLGQLQVGLSKARRLCQCSTARIVTLETLAMQMDGEPWLQPPARLDIELKGQALMLRRLNSEPLARMAHTVAEVLDHCEHSGIITGSQRHAITTELAAKLHTDH